MNFKTLALSSILSITGLVGVTTGYAAPVEARNWCGVNNKGMEICIKQTGYTHYEVTLDDKYSKEGYILHVDCASGRWRARAVDGYSHSDLSREAYKICSMV